jgi:hypothetical protein
VKENRFVVHTSTLEQGLADEARRLNKRAKQLTYGKDREELLRKARQNEVAAHISEWLASPGLQPPKVNLEQDSWKPMWSRLRSPAENINVGYPTQHRQAILVFQMDCP